MKNSILEKVDVIDSLHATPEYVEQGFPMVRVVDVNNEFLELENCLNVDKDTCDKHNKNHKPRRGDTVITRVGSYGMTAYVDTDDEFCLGQNIAIISPKDKEDGKFIYYYLQSPYIQSIIYGNSGGSSYKCIGLEQIKNFPLEIDGIDCSKVGEILYSLDKKAKNNNDISAEISSLLKLVYQYWFIQFDFPTDEGKGYRQAGNAMVMNEIAKRQIPKGWEMVKVKDCIQHINTGLNPRKNFVLGEGNIRYITVKNLTRLGTIDFSGCDFIDEKAKEIVHNRSNVEIGDILFASIAPLGRCSIVNEYPEDWDINESVFSIRPNYSKVSSEYLYMFFMSDSFVKKAEHNSTGSVFNGIRISTLEDMLILLPPKDIIDRFTELVKPLFECIYANEKQNTEIASVKQFLLPLLMNGQVGFKEIEK